jgi:hypothetical protein
MVPEVEAVLALGESMEEEERVEEHACGVGGVQISLRTSSRTTPSHISSMGNLISNKARARLSFSFGNCQNQGLNLGLAQRALKGGKANLRALTVYNFQVALLVGFTPVQGEALGSMSAARYAPPPAPPQSPPHMV